MSVIMAVNMGGDDFVAKPFDGGVLMANHGALCVGATLAEAALRCEMLEIFAKIFFLTKSCGGGVSLTADDARREAADVAERYGQR